MKNGYAKIFFTLLILFFTFMTSMPVFADNTATPGAFSRMGFGPRGIGAGNTAVSIPAGYLGSYYNPAAIAFIEEPNLEASYAFLTLDRSLNFFHFTTKVPPTAGLSLSVINAGVSGIDGRTRDGIHTEYLSTSENQFSLAFGNRLNDNLSLGVTIKLYYYHLYEGMNSTTVGIDAGILYRVNQNLSFGGVIKDINSKYNWDSSNVYGSGGRVTTDKFPLLFQIGGSYLTTDRTLLIAVQGEYSDAVGLVLRMGVDAYLTEFITLRGGIENLTVSDHNKPSLGISVTQPVKQWRTSFHYTLVFEPHSPSNMHILSVGFEF